MRGFSYYSIVLSLFSCIGCSHVGYEAGYNLAKGFSEGLNTNQEKPIKKDLSQFKHQQKVVVGMDKKEVVSKFGVPDRVQKTILGVSRHRIEIEYLYKVFCASPSCRVYVDPETDKVTSFVNFKYPYTDLLD